jgi:hypothetical protein
MKFRELLNRVKRLWLRSTFAAIGFFIAPIVVAMVYRPAVCTVGMYDLGHAPSLWHDPIRWELWLWATAVACSLASAMISLAAGTAYVIGRRLPDYTDDVSPA